MPIPIPTSLDPVDLLADRDATRFSPDINFGGTIPLKDLTRYVTRELERKIIVKVLEAHHWNRRKAARTLCISYRTLLYKIKQTGLQ